MYRPLPLNISVCFFPKTKNILLPNHRTMIRMENLAWIKHCYLTDSPYSNFVSCPSSVLRSDFITWSSVLPGAARRALSSCPFGVS